MAPVLASNVNCSRKWKFENYPAFVNNFLFVLLVLKLCSQTLKIFRALIDCGQLQTTVKLISKKKISNVIIGQLFLRNTWICFLRTFCRDECWHNITNDRSILRMITFLRIFDKVVYSMFFQYLLVLAL